MIMESVLVSGAEQVDVCVYLVTSPADQLSHWS